MSRSSILPLVGLLLFGSVLPGSGEELRDDLFASLSRAMSSATESLQQNELALAESRYRSALLEGWLLLGGLAVDAGDLERAKDAFERAAVSAAEVRRPHLALALVELQLGQAESALELLRGLKATDLSDALVRRLLPRALMATGEVEEAVREMEELHILAPADLETVYSLARAYLGQGRLDEAVALFAELVEERTTAATRVLVGRTYRDFDHYDLARQELLAALALDPEVPRAHYYLGTVELYDQGQDGLDEAMAQFQAELRVVPDDPMASLYLGIGLVEKRRFEEAVPLLELAGRVVAGRADAYQYLGRAYLELNRLTDAVATLRRGLAVAEAAPEALPARGPDDARKRQLSSLNFLLAQALRRVGDGDAAARHFDAAKELSAESAEGARELLDAYFRADDGDRNLVTSTWPLELLPLSGLAPGQRQAATRAIRRSLAQAYFNLGVLQTRAGEPARAALLYAEGAGLEPDFPRLQYALGTALFNSGQFAAATGALSEAREVDPADETLRRMLALAWFNSDHYDDAADLLQDDPQRATNPSLQYTYAVALVRGGRLDEAEPVFATLLAENADWPELNVLLGQAHAQQDDYDTAIHYLERALALKSDVAEAQGTLGDIYLRQGRLDQAEAALRAEVATRPEDRRAQHTLAVVLDLNRKPDEALARLRSLLEVEPAFADARYLLGKILLARGEAEEARAQLEAAAQLSPADANIHYQLGQAYLRLGRRDRAARELEAYRRLKSEGREGEGS